MKDLHLFHIFHYFELYDMQYSINKHKMEASNYTNGYTLPLAGNVLQLLLKGSFSF